MILVTFYFFRVFYLNLVIYSSDFIDFIVHRFMEIDSDIHELRISNTSVTKPQH